MTLLLASTKAPPAAEKPKSVKAVAPEPKKDEYLTQEPSAQTLESAVNELQAHLNLSTSELKIQVDESTGRAYTKIIDPNTGKVLLQMPPEEVLATSRRLRELSADKGTASVLMDKEG
jgi:flagellar protein FlaG